MCRNLYIIMNIATLVQLPYFKFVSRHYACMKDKSYQFTASLEAIHEALKSTVVFLPEAIIKKLPAGRIRTKGTMNGTPFDLAVQYKKDGGRYFVVGGILRRAAGLKEGDRVTVVFHLTDPNKLVIPEELEAVLEQDDEARKVWDTFTLGYQRSLVYYITSVKNSDSRIKRALEIAGKAKIRALSGQQAKAKSKK